jgi:Fe-Mn family superoxide dismutase
MDIKKYVDIVILAESKSEKVEQDKLSFGRRDLDPVMSEDTIKYHYDGLAAKYSERYNKGEGDPRFNYGGAVLHNLFFGNLAPPKSGNKPSGISKTLIDEKYGDFDKFKQAVEKSAMGIQGSGWVYMDTAGKIDVIRNHEYRKTMKIALLIDWWEHSWFTDYGPDKSKYLNNIWKIIDWAVVDIRLQGA